MGNRVEIVRGLEAGERIVTSGTFLIDSESKLELAAQGMYTTLSKDPVCGIDVAMRKAEKAGLKASHGGKTYYFHSEECKQKFEKEPERYVKESAVPEFSVRKNQMLSEIGKRTPYRRFLITRFQCQ